MRKVKKDLRMILNGVIVGRGDLYPPGEGFFFSFKEEKPNVIPGQTVQIEDPLKGDRISARVIGVHGSVVSLAKL